MTFIIIVALTIFTTLCCGQAISGSIWETTECKRCPYNLCTNTKIYDAKTSPNANFTCWTSGTEVFNDTTWLKTTDDCYVTQYDAEESPETAELPFCGVVEKPQWPKRNGRTRYYSECYRMPWFDGLATKYYKNNVELNLICVTRNVTGYWHEVLEKPGTWYKTNSDCFVHETTLWPIDDDLDDCGPLDTELPERQPPDTETPTPASSSLSPQSSTTVISGAITAAPFASDTANHPRSSHVTALARRFLYNTTIGEEYVNCTFTSNSTDRAHGVKRVYEFDQLIYPQCGTVDNGVIMLFTTDFCWIRDDECWEQLQHSTLRSQQFPHCEKFVDTVS